MGPEPPPARLLLLAARIMHRIVVTSPYQFADHRTGVDQMAWAKPKIEEISCGIEINMYQPADDDGTLF